MPRSGSLDQGREAFARRAWSDAFAALAAADRDAPLEPDDLKRLATAAALTGRAGESGDAWARAHQAFLKRGEVPQAARCACWLAFGLMNQGERTRAAAWIDRARRLLDAGSHDCVEAGYVLLPLAHERLAAGDIAAAYATFCQAADIGERFADPDLIALGRHSRGRLLIRMGEVDQGVRLLDQAMVDVEAREVSALAVGDVYCSVIEGCLEVFDLRRAQEWTASLTRWCEAQPDLVAYTGQCLVRRAEILQLHGSWSDAAAEAQRACERFLQGPGQPAAGAAFYQKGELHRLRGEFDAAEEAYRQASRYGGNPQPGLAQLRLARGQLDAAHDAIRHALQDQRSRPRRPRLLAASVEIMLAAGDFGAARAAADELAALAGELDAPLLRAAAAQARGAVLLAEGDARSALASLREAVAAWQELDAPHDAAALELDSASRIFRELGARPDLARVESFSMLAAETPAAGCLSPREVQVLRLVAVGKTNRAIAAELFISERTVERHVSNIFGKLDVSSRSAATAFAYEHQLL